MPNSISEWFGFRVSPVVAGGSAARNAQLSGVCPFLSESSATDKKCVKAQNSRGVCTIGSDSNGHLQDWVVCPYRTISSPILSRAATRLFGSTVVRLIPAPDLAKPSEQKRIRSEVKAGATCVAYFMDKLGGEIDLPGSLRSPKFKLDATMVELIPTESGLGLGQFGIVEVQTMDFHGSYKHATRRLANALELHPRDFAKQLSANPHWAAEEIEGPNIANVFERTIYQLLFKLRLGEEAGGAGCVMALPQAVWDSWQPHLACPIVKSCGSGGSTLLNSRAAHDKARGWILVFDIDPTPSDQPSPVVVKNEISIDVDSLATFAFKNAPAAAMEAIGGASGLKEAIVRRLRRYWSEIS